jgi:DeoR family transcriptional regulator, suf operon transcriptional repressor
VNRAVHPALSAMPETRQAIIKALKKRGELRAEDLAETSGITASGARQHLQSLEMDGLIVRREVREGVGRPKLVYKLTPAADALYPRGYSELTNELLEYVQDDDPALLELIFKRRMQRRIDGAKQRLEGLRTLETRVAELTRILDEDGYLADFEALPDGSYRITEHNCAIFGVAMKYGQACSSEIEFIRAVLPGVTVERVAHMIAGAHVCAYAITPKKVSRGRTVKTAKPRAS